MIELWAKEDQAAQTKGPNDNFKSPPTFSESAKRRNTINRAKEVFRRSKQLTQMSPHNPISLSFSEESGSRCAEACDPSPIIIGRKHGHNIGQEDLKVDLQPIQPQTNNRYQGLELIKETSEENNFKLVLNDSQTSNPLITSLDSHPSLSSPCPKGEAQHILENSVKRQ